MLLAAGTASGVLLGLLLVYLQELADETFRSSDDIRQAIGLPCFALLPRVRHRTLGASRVDEYAARNPNSSLAEQLRALRAALWHDPARPRTVAVTAARAGEGKTTVALALGRLAAMNGERVVVPDCDIRKPSFARLLQGEASPGLVDCLQDHAPLARIIRKDALSGMDWIPAGKADADALGLLMSAAMVRLLQSLRDEYDLVLLDAPPAQAVTDARIVAGNADATLLCVRWRSTPRSTVLHAIELLDQAHANVVGTALTQVDMRIHVRSGYADAEVYHPHHGGYYRE
jgi:capsular exopolysaccharide synthesis family protein